MSKVAKKKGVLKEASSESDLRGLTVKTDSGALSGSDSDAKSTKSAKSPKSSPLSAGTSPKAGRESKFSFRGVMETLMPSKRSLCLCKPVF